MVSGNYCMGSKAHIESVYSLKAEYCPRPFEVVVSAPWWRVFQKRMIMDFLKYELPVQVHYKLKWRFPW